MPNLNNNIPSTSTQTVDLTPVSFVGEIKTLYSTTIPNHYLLCDGSTFDENTYPLLY